MPARIEIRLLGPVHVVRDGQTVRGFESRKAVALMAYLAVRGPPAPRTQLADLLWPDLSEDRGRANLSGALHSLSTLLPGCLSADRHTVAFRQSADVWLDTTAFDEHAREGSATAMVAAANLYRDEFLADLYVDHCPAFERWLVRHREEWRTRITQGLGALVDHHAARGEYTEGLRDAARLLEIEPWREEAHRQLMVLLASAGQRSAALAQYKTCRRVLADELGVDPSAETDALYARIRADQVAVHVAPARLTPAPLTENNVPVKRPPLIGS